MTEAEKPSISVRQLYLMTAAFTVAGICWQWAASGPRSALAFFLGGVGSFGNLWAFHWLTKVLERAARTEPEPGSERKNAWGAGLFIGRYAGLWVVGYATVKALDVSPVSVLLGLLASTAAVLASSVVELVRSLFGK